MNHGASPSRTVTVQYKDLHTNEVYYLADFEFTTKSDFTLEKSKAKPMTLAEATKFVERIRKFSKGIAGTVIALP